MDVDDRFRQMLIDAGDAERDEDSLTTLAQRYSYVFPDDRSLAALARLGPLVEMGAGTGYWAYRLRALGTDVVAFDQAPPDGARPNRYHATTPTWTEVVAGDHTILTRYSDRALLLCWPPLFSSLGEFADLLQREYRCGDWGRRPSNRARARPERVVHTGFGVRGAGARAVPGTAAHAQHLAAPADVVTLCRRPQVVGPGRGTTARPAVSTTMQARIRGQ